MKTINSTMYRGYEIKHLEDGTFEVSTPAAIIGVLTVGFKTLEDAKKYCDQAENLKALNKS